MAYKSVLTVVLSPQDAEAQILAAAQVAEANDGHLAILALGVDHTQLGYSYIDAGAVMMASYIDRAEDKARLVEAAARKAVLKLGPTVRWSVDTATVLAGSLTEIVANSARFADLVVLPRIYGEGKSLDCQTVIEAALFDSRTAVLVIPPGDLRCDLGSPKRIVLAWNQSSEALSAARVALPLLTRAEIVDLTVIDPPAHGPERSDPGGSLAEFLIRHGAKAQVSVLALNLPTASAVLNRHAEEFGADLIVMGAYGHAGIREAILGGATRAMLEKASVPVLMVH